ncbi:MAG: FAD-dependent oxidoreductase [Verrucomicrobiota bacterium]|nr:FAD-dependent oxidoreductase [Verrucomicrobiota bacterium]
MLKEQPAIALWRKHRCRSVTLDRGRIAALVADDLANNTVRTFSGEIFIDASYEGDVMARAHVPYRVGREARAEYGEYLAGNSAGPRELRGLGDHHTMAYNYRVALTLITSDRVLIPKPDNYDPEPFR